MAEPDNKAAIDALKAIDAIVYQNLKSKRVIEVKLNGNKKLKNADLVHLSGFSAMTDLSIEETKITSEGLKHLIGLKKLEWLNLWNTGVDDKGLAHLKN